MEFIKEITILENTINRKEEFITSLGRTTVLLTALDTTDIYNPDGTITEAPRFLKAIARYVAAYTDSSYFIKLKDLQATNNQALNSYIESNNIKLIIDINAPINNEEQDIKIIPLNNVDTTILTEIKEAFQEQNLTKVEVETPPKTVLDIDVIKINLPATYRDINDPATLEKVCDALINFIKMYINITD